jgi:hypothetical protein
VRASEYFGRLGLGRVSTSSSVMNGEALSWRSFSFARQTTGRSEFHLSCGAGRLPKTQDLLLRQLGQIVGMHFGRQISSRTGVHSTKRAAVAPQRS